MSAQVLIHRRAFANISDLMHFAFACGRQIGSSRRGNLVLVAQATGLPRHTTAAEAAALRERT